MVEVAQKSTHIAMIVHIIQPVANCECANNQLDTLVHASCPPRPLSDRHTNAVIRDMSACTAQMP